jgi:hypothetical protein
MSCLPPYHQFIIFPLFSLFLCFFVYSFLSSHSYLFCCLGGKEPAILPYLTPGLVRFAVVVWGVLCVGMCACRCVCVCVCTCVCMRILSRHCVRIQPAFGMITVHTYIFTDNGLDDRMIGVRFLAGAGNFSLRHRVQTGSGAHPVSYQMCTLSSFLGRV